MFTPNNRLSGETIQVFISGNSPSEFEMWSGGASYGNYLFLGKDWGWSYQIDIGPSSMAANNWQYNSSTGSYGFYATIKHLKTRLKSLTMDAIDREQEEDIMILKDQVNLLQKRQQLELRHIMGTIILEA